MPETGEGFSAMRWFQEAEKALSEVLEPGAELDNETWERLGRPDVLFVGNSRLSPEYFSLRGVDYQTVGPLVYPGKSCLLDFLDIRQNQMTLTKAGREVITQRTFGKWADRRDNAYIAAVPQINYAGYKVFYAPVKGNELHLRLVWEGHLGYDYPVLTDLPNVPADVRIAMASIWAKAKVVS
ncbi:hypothetical protein HY440_03320 [Candidatus Microgenomates bacterium]|nr:hypothetical protein [Candidatus Microgenomates bacterium]